MSRLGASLHGPRGAIANDATVRGWWHEAVATALPNHPTLAGIKPHVLRHEGMTYWFASNDADGKRIQKWGGWTSLVQMLDTYRGVIDSLEHLNLEGLDRFAEMYEEVEPKSVNDPTPTPFLAVGEQAGNIVSLDDY